jgi:hypothetical protein
MNFDAKSKSREFFKPIFLFKEMRTYPIVKPHSKGPATGPYFSMCGGVTTEISRLILTSYASRDLTIDKGATT